MNPDRIYAAFVVIMNDVWPRESIWRKTPATDEEWQELELRVQAFFTLNRPKESHEHTNK